MAHSREGNGWKECHTLGKRAKFCWKFDNRGLTIRRKFENAVREEQKEIMDDELGKVQDYVKEYWGTGLGNSVSPLSTEGIGWFLREKLGWKRTADFQLASQIAALFVGSGAWRKVDVSRKTKSGMQFEVSHKGKVDPKDIDWQERLWDFYHKSPDCTMTK